MIEKFTKEEIEQIKKELGMMAQPNSKCVIVNGEHIKLTPVLTLMHDKYDETMFSVLNKDLNASLYMLTDVITNNYTTMDRVSSRSLDTWADGRCKPYKKTCRTSGVKPEIQNVYREVYSKLVSICLEYMEDCHEL